MKQHYVVKLMPWTYSRREYLELIPDWILKQESCSVRFNNEKKYWTIVLNGVEAKANDVIAGKKHPKIMSYKDFMKKEKITDLSLLYQE